jgi:MFS family permease
METGSEKPEARTTGFAAFRYRDFSFFIVGRSLSQGAHQMLLVAIGYQIYDQTGDPVSLALINLAMIIPVFACFPLTGYIADRFDRSRILGVCYGVQTVSTLGLCLYTLLGLPVSWVLYGIILAIGTSRAVYAPTSNAVIPTIVPADVMTNAIAWNASLSKFMQVSAPAAGGLAYLAGPEVVYAGAAGAFLTGCVTVCLMGRRPSGGGKKPLDWESLSAGLRYIVNSPVIRGIVAIDFLVALLGAVSAMLPIFAKDILEAGPAGAGILRSAMGAGGLLAAALIAQLSMGERAGAKMLIGVVAFGVAVVVFGLSTSFWLSAAAMLVLGAADMINVTVRHTLLQVATPDALRGRVSAVNSLSSNSGSELGGFRVGMFAAALGPVWAVVVGGLAVIAVGLGSFKAFPQLAKVDRLETLGKP